MKSLYVKFAMICAFCSSLPIHLVAMEEGEEGSQQYQISDTRTMQFNLPERIAVSLTIIGEDEKEAQFTTYIPYTKIENMKQISLGHLGNALIALYKNLKEKLESEHWYRHMHFEDAKTQQRISFFELVDADAVNEGEIIAKVDFSLADEEKGEQS